MGGEKNIKLKYELLWEPDLKKTSKKIRRNALSQTKKGQPRNGWVMTFDEQFEKQEAQEQSMWTNEKPEKVSEGKEIALKKEIHKGETEIYDYLKSE